MRPDSLSSALRRAIAALALAASVAAAQEGTPPHAPTDSMLNRLVGTWTMIGQVGGDSVRYALRVQRTLQGRYVDLHMIDASTPPAYEARVTIGADTLPGRVIVHWMDSFGAAYSVPAGYGTARGDSIVFTFAYPSGTFRDVLSANADGSWRLQIDAQTPQGWRPFADYRVLLAASRETMREPFDVAPAPANPTVFRSLLQQAATRLVSTYDELLGVEKRVQVRVQVDTAGQVRTVELASGSGHRAVDAEAMSIIARTRFTPAQRGGVAVQAWFVLPVHFVFPDP